MKSLSEISDKGERLSTLKALRHKLAEALDNTSSGRDIASLALQLEKVLAQIAEVEENEKQKLPNEIDELIATHKEMRLRHRYENDYDDDEEL